MRTHSHPDPRPFAGLATTDSFGTSTFVIRLRALGIALLVVASLFVSASTALAAGPLDQQQVQTPNWYLNGLLQWAQVITPGRSGTLDQVDLLGACPAACSGALVVSVYSLSNGVPQAPLASTSVPLSQLQFPSTVAPDWRSVAFSTPAYVFQGTQYAILVDGSGATGSFQVSARDGDPYPGGQLLDYNGTLRKWEAADSGLQDLDFRTYVTAAPPPAGNPAPTTSGVTPNSVQNGGPAFTLSVTGTGFVTSSLVQWNGIACDGISGQTPCSTSFLNSTQLNASIPAAAISGPVCAAITVLTPGPGGGVSAPQALQVTSALPLGAVTVSGADCTGTTDSTSVFVTALQQAAAQRATLVVPIGRFLVKPDSLIVHDGVTVSGLGASLISSGPGYILLDLSGSNIDVEGVTVDGASHVLHVVEVEHGATNLTLHWVTVQNGGQDPNPGPNYSAQAVGIRVQGDGKNMLFDSIVVQNIVATHSDGTSMIARGLLFDNGGPAQTVSKQVTVRNSSFVNVGPKDDGDCLVIQGSSDLDAGLVITGNRFDQCHKRAIKLQVGGVIVQNNTINNPFSGNNAYQFRPETPDPATGKPTFDMFAAIALHASNMLVSGNTTTGPGSFYQAIEITSVSGGTPNNVTIVRNTLSNGAGSETVAPSSFIRSDVPITNLAVRSNTLTNAPIGVYFAQPVTSAAIDCNTYTSVASQAYGGIGTEQPCIAVPASPAPPQQAVAIPSYFYPGGTWNQLDASAPTTSIAVINPNSGPGVAINFDYVNQVQQTRARGVTVLGYVSTRYGNRPVADIKSDVDAYYAWYDVGGIFFDEASTSCTTASFYAGLNTYVKGKNAAARTVINPGTATSECYMAAADVVITFEGDYSTYLSGYSAQSWVANYPPNRFWHLVYATATDQQMQAVVSLSKSRGAGWIYVTPDVLSNPWDTLPTDPYWSDELTAASRAAPPSLSSVSPSSAQVQPVSGGGQAITVAGANFVPGSVVNWQASGASTPVALSTTFVSPTQLTATIPSSDLSTARYAELTVTAQPASASPTGSLAFFVTATPTTVTNVVSASNTIPNGTFTLSTLQSPPGTPAPLGTVGSIGLTATGTGTATVAQYTVNPETVAPTGGASAYFDVHVASGSSLNTLQVVDCDLTSTPSNPAYGILQWWNGTAWSVAANQTPNSPQPGCTTLSLSAGSSPALTQLVGTAFAVVVDRTPPTTTATVTGTRGNHGWYRTGTPVQVSLSASDNAGGSGVASTVFSLDGGGSQRYVGLIGIASDGQHTLSFSSTDLAGNVEPSQSLPIAVDQTAPTVTYSGNQGTYGILNQVSITCSATDNPGGSGLDSTTCVSVVGSAYTFSASGPNTFSASATDQAGNTAAGTTSFTLKVSAGDLCTLTRQFVEGSTNYKALPPAERARVDLSATALCQRLATAPALSPAQKTPLIAEVQAGVRILQRAGWLTPGQAAVVASLVKAL